MGYRSVTDCMVAAASDSSSRWRIEPIHLKTFPQRHARSMQHYPKIAVRNRQRRADLLARHSVHFTHREHRTDLFRQFREAITHHLPEFGTMHHLIRLGFPFMRPEVVIPKTYRHEFLRKLIGKKFHIGKRCLSPKLPEMIHNLVFQNADEPASL